MSRCAHAQSPCRLRQLPKCPKCKGQFALVFVQYVGSKKPVYEWECFRCMKTFPREAFNEEPLLDEDKQLKEMLDADQRKSRNRK